MKKRILIISLFILSAASGVSFARDSSSLSFLNLSRSARDAALGGAVSALADNVDALNVNPAGLSRIQSKQLSFTHAEWLLNTSYDSAGCAFPTKQGAWAVSGMAMNLGKQDGRDENGNKSGDFSALNSVVSLGYSRKISGIRLGSNLKFIQSRIGSDHADGAALDVGSQFSVGKIQLGAAVRNLGPAMTYLHKREALPTTLALGAGGELFSHLGLSGDYQFETRSHHQEVDLGLEYRPVSSITFRSGYLSSLASAGAAGSNNSLTAVNSLVGGIGVQLRKYQLDYAFTPTGPLGATHRFSLSAGF